MIPENFYKYNERPIWTTPLPCKLEKKHNTKEGVYGRISVLEGELEYTIFDDDEKKVSKDLINVSNSAITLPQQWHKLKPLGDVSIFFEFFKEKPEYITIGEREIYKKYKKSPHIEVFQVIEEMKKSNLNTVLDIGCGGGRNSICFAENNFQVTAIDKNSNAIQDIDNISIENNLDITTSIVDLNDYIIPLKYDCIISTVALQFLDDGIATNIIKNMQENTNTGGYNIIIIPIDAEDHLCPIRFPSLLKKGELKSLYENWEIIEYNEMFGRFHREDENGNRIISRFATVIARKDIS